MAAQDLHPPSPIPTEELFEFRLRWRVTFADVIEPDVESFAQRWILTGDQTPHREAALRIKLKNRLCLLVFRGSIGDNEEALPWDRVATGELQFAGIVQAEAHRVLSHLGIGGEDAHAAIEP